MTSIDVREAVHSFATDIGGECTWDAISKADTTYNVKSVVLELTSKGHPKVWWRDPMWKLFFCGKLLGHEMSELLGTPAPP